MSGKELQKQAIRKSPYLVEIPASARPEMRVPARVFADERIWDAISGDRTLTQLLNVATLPGVVDCVYAMPDAHEGYGFPIGGVAAFRAEDGIISPGGVGYDINCGVRLLVSELDTESVVPKLEPLVHDLSRTIPSGRGRGRTDLVLSPQEMEGVLQGGATFLLERAMAQPEDLDRTESRGGFAQADPGAVSERAKKRGANQLGTMGSGNHFVEVQRVETVFDTVAATTLGLIPGRIAVLIHTGSRGLGHQVCTDYVRRLDSAPGRSEFTLPDRELACASYRSAAGREYFGAMNAAANYAFANRQALTHSTRQVFAQVFGSEGTLRVVYDVAHNMAKLEEHAGTPVLVHRKGATRAFGPSNPETPDAYRAIGQPVLIPGSMGTASYVLAGTDESLGLAFGSCCHGAGRRMSRGAARRRQPGAEVRRSLEERGIVVRCPSNRELAEESPHAYKDVDRVVDVVHGAGLAKKVARLVPLGVVKG